MSRTAHAGHAKKSIRITGEIGYTVKEKQKAYEKRFKKKAMK